MLSKISKSPKDKILHDSTYIKYIRKSNSQKQKNGWLPGARRWGNEKLPGARRLGKWVQSFKTCRKFWRSVSPQHESYLTLWNCTLKMVKVVNLVLCVLS